MARRKHPSIQPGRPSGKNKKDVWYKLDLSAIVYPTLQRRDFSSVYRLSVVLKEEIDPALLQQALDQTLTRFPTYKVAIRKGLFWRYLEPNNRPGPYVREDIKNPCMPMHFKGNNRYLIRVYYYGRRIALEAHHCLGDGTGGMCLLQTCILVYRAIPSPPPVSFWTFAKHRTPGNWKTPICVMPRPRSNRPVRLRKPIVYGVQKSLSIH